MKGPWLGNIATSRSTAPNGGLIGFAPDPRTGHECGRQPLSGDSIP